MKAKKIVRVKLKNPALRRIRKNFRDIIELAVKQESNRLHVDSRVYRKRSRESTDPVEKERLERKEGYLGRKSARLNSSLSKSIIQCGLGGGCASYIEATDYGLHPENSPTNLDMAWIPFHGAWFCTKCCENLIEGDKILRKEKHPDYIRHLREGGFL
ncbi:hypothetical protein ES705_24791 [subsurface metagenome]|jgi:hypothetical protein